MSGQEWLLVLGMTAVTFAVRYPILALVGRVNLPPGVMDAMRYIPPAVLAAIIAPAVLMPQGTLWVGWENSYLVAGIVTGLISWRTGKLLWTILGGMAAFWLWRILVGL
jgi:branched-subunit amino acid transport protein